MSAKFEGKVVLVAGGTGGLGRAVTLAFLEEGAKLVVTYRKQEEFDALTSAAGTNGSRLEGHTVDVTDEAAVRQMIERIVGKHRRLDVMVNTVGGYAGGIMMLKEGHGAIVNVAAKAAFDHAAGAAAYAASKSAAVALLDSLAADLKGSGVRVNTILPSIIDTEANRQAMPKADFAKWPKPEEIARVILFLCSDDAKVIHGAAIPVYGDS